MLPMNSCTNRIAVTAQKNITQPATVIMAGTEAINAATVSRIPRLRWIARNGRRMRMERIERKNAPSDCATITIKAEKTQMKSIQFHAERKYASCVEAKNQKKKATKDQQRNERTKERTNELTN